DQVSEGYESGVKRASRQVAPRPSQGPQPTLRHREQRVPERPRETLGLLLQLGDDVGRDGDARVGLAARMGEEDDPRQRTLRELRAFGSPGEAAFETAARLAPCI